MRITLIVEGETELVFMPCLRDFVRCRLTGHGPMPKLISMNQRGRIPTGGKLQRLVETLLNDRHSPADHVIALTDVYTGTTDFKDAEDAKEKMRKWVGNEPRFHPHVAQHDFEAWLLPYWSTIKRLAGHNGAAPSGQPELVNHNQPPALRLRKIFAKGTCRRAYVKTRDAKRILKDNDLMVAVGQCPELRALVNTILSVSGGTVIP
ncbi:MAG: DUF4276 family protein [Magnetococcales bacterium]|nr:DUF4276 family protein [Magnetococcales bacterium]